VGNPGAPKWNLQTATKQSICRDLPNFSKTTPSSHHQCAMHRVTGVMTEVAFPRSWHWQPPIAKHYSDLPEAKKRSSSHKALHCARVTGVAFPCCCQPRMSRRTCTRQGRGQGPYRHCHEHLKGTAGERRLRVPTKR
jgi:hypothetical protein